MAKRKQRRKYRSGLEEELHNGPLKNLEYEPCKITYTPEEKEYTPDFVQYYVVGLDNEDYRQNWYEVKGRFRTYDEAKKYIAIRKALPPGTILRFILSNPNVKAYPQAKHITLGEWLTKNGFEWCHADEIPEAWTV